MKTFFRRSFLRDLRKIENQRILDLVQHAILEIEQAGDLGGISNLQKLSGTNNSYRIRVEDYRIGVAIEADTVEFVRCLHRRDIYKYFRE